MHDAEGVQMNVKVFIIEDHEIVREAVAELIEQEPDMKVVGYAAGGREALEKLSTTNVDFLLVDVSLPEMSGIDLIREIQIRHPSVLCLVVSGHNEALYAGQARSVGASGYLTKSEAGHNLVPAIRQILSGSTYFAAPPPAG